ncbi:uncharacterized protein LOC126885174 [Diabrotica virgifera virgifera]|uniref:MADF domain-containing protein n=1 Tax=Diabrotica virgifera virgifera TaxID=50390 RepID=A0ABM5KBJ5_DIAVI|nr:uncharacterized protein LOC126885174 [Diabrotica virgifera virgifera]
MGKIAKEIKATVAVCKERWKNLRGSYTRYLKKCTPSGSAAKKTRPYYLAEYMQFLTPFTKSRPMKSSLEPLPQQSIDYSCDSNSGDNESQCENEEDNESQHLMALENEPPLLSPTESHYSTRDDT